MKTFPMFLQLAGRKVVFAGSSEKIARQLRLILRTEAEILICSPEAVAEGIEKITASGRVNLRPRWPEAGDLADAALVFISSGDEARDAALAQRARMAGAVVNVIDRPALCTAFTPSIAAGDDAVAAQVPDHARPQGSIALVGAGPGAADLLTLRALRHLQEADVIYYDRLVDPQVLDLARRDAEMVFVGKEVGGHSWPQSRIDAVIVTAALQGKRVVRLKSGDPSIFGRAAEELEAARTAGIPIEIVPGVTAASAAAASLARPLTERGQTEALVLVTGTCRPGDPDPDWGALARPGTTLALYMAVGKLGQIRDALLRARVPADSEVEIVSAASTGQEAVLRARLGDLGSGRQRVVAPALVLVRHRKPQMAGILGRAELQDPAWVAM